MLPCALCLPHLLLLDLLTFSAIITIYYYLLLLLS